MPSKFAQLRILDSAVTRIMRQNSRFQRKKTHKIFWKVIILLQKIFEFLPDPFSTTNLKINVHLRVHPPCQPPQRKF